MDKRKPTSPATELRRKHSLQVGIRAKLWLDRQGQERECSRKGPFHLKYFFQAPPHLLQAGFQLHLEPCPHCSGLQVWGGSVQMACGRLPLPSTEWVASWWLLLGAPQVLAPPRPARHCPQGLEQVGLAPTGGQCWPTGSLSVRKAGARP